MSREKVRRVLALIDAEARSPGSRAREVATRLRELLALYEADCAAPAAREPGLLRALAAMNARPGETWTVASLARAAGMSRAAFARKFALAFGAPPLRHLHDERMARAAALLAESDESIPRVAERVGYRSEWAFRRAFKRHHGIAPGTYRRTIGAAGAAVPRMLMVA